MKKILLWKVCMVLLVVVTCFCVGAWAQSTTTQAKKFSDTFWRGESSKKFLEAGRDETKKSAASKITADEWNVLMQWLDGLDNSNLTDFFVPGWAIMPFYSDECPDWWSEYAVADWKFLMWTTVAHGDVGNIMDRDVEITLLAGNIPQHQHYLFWPKEDEGPRTRTGKEDGQIHYIAGEDWKATYPWSGYFTFYWTYWNPEEYQIRGLKNVNESKIIKGVTSYQIGGKSKPNSIDITNPYVKVIYCRKDYYDSCPGWYLVGPAQQVDERDCWNHSEGWRIDEFQIGNWWYCGKCVAKTCPVWSCIWIAGVVAVWYSWDEPCYQSQECEDSGDSGYRCANPVPYYEAQQLQDQWYQCSCWGTECCCN